MCAWSLPPILYQILARIIYADGHDRSLLQDHGNACRWLGRRRWDAGGVKGKRRFPEGSDAWPSYEEVLRGKGGGSRPSEARRRAALTRPALPRDPESRTAKRLTTYGALCLPGNRERPSCGGIASGETSICGVAEVRRARCLGENGVKDLISQFLFHLHRRTESRNKPLSPVAPPPTYAVVPVCRGAAEYRSPVQFVVGKPGTDGGLWNNIIPVSLRNLRPCFPPF